MSIKFVHTNIVAKDWDKLAQFYIEVFGCVPVYPKRDLKGEWIDEAIGINNVHIRGIYLRLPGYMDGPTLEISEYNKENQNNKFDPINRDGFAHIAFLVDNIEFYLNKTLEHGGSKVGKIVEQVIEGVGILTVVYVRDCEGNIVEIQKWKK